MAKGLWGVILSCVAAAILGLVGVALAGELAPPLSGHESPLFPAVDRGVEGMNGASLVLLGLAGFAPAAFRRAHPLLVGISTMALFPVLSIAEMVADPTSHNLWPFEWFFYALETLPGILGAFLGRRFARNGSTAGSDDATKSGPE